MKILKHHIQNLLNYDMLLRRNSRKTGDIPIITKVVLSCKFEINYKESLSIFLSILTFLRPIVTYYKKTTVSLNLKKGEPAGVKVILRKEQIESFLTLLLFEILPSQEEVSSFKFYKGIGQCHLKNLFEYEDIFAIQIYLYDATILDIVIHGKNITPGFFTG